MGFAWIAKYISTDILLLPIKAQNAMLTLRRTAEVVIFECFEASPQAGAVMECKESLVRTFPAQARAIPTSIFDDPHFRDELAAILSKLDSEVINEMMPQTQIAGSKVAETRDTARPWLVSDMLMAILASLGEPFTAHQISKRTKDDVLWRDAHLPWRRSSLWLAIRVTIQITLCREFLAEEGNVQFKNFMIYLMSEIASEAGLLDEPADRCHVILAKIARRVHKLGAHTHVFVQKEALNTCQRVKARHSLKWEEVQRSDAVRPTTVQNFSFVYDTILSLCATRPYLDKALADSENSANTMTSFTPICPNWLAWDRGIPIIDTSSASKDTFIFILSEVESWVAVSLPSWIAKFDASSPASEDCIALAKLGEQYWRTSESTYNGAPEQLSTMLLVIAELWRAIDCLAISLFPLLKNFSPEVSTDLFYPLLLPKKSHMQRLDKVEQYIRSRHAQAKPGRSSIFSSPKSGSFAVAYYATSTAHKDLRAQIEAEAETKRAAKELEWEEASHKHQQLISDAGELECENTKDVHGWTVHSPLCKKCSLLSAANEMKISKYEWPLPPDEDSCICAVFELDCPAGFVAWRNFTWMLTHDIGSPERTHGEKYAEILNQYSGLRDYSRTQSSRMILASKKKSFQKTHYIQSFPVGYDEIYSDNALQYQMVECTRFICVEKRSNKPSLHYKCIQPLPEGPYKNLQFAVDWTTHTQNEILAQQDTCSHALGLHEFISFGSLRADGEKTQWLNIQRELTASNLDLNSESVLTLFLYAAFQVGSHGRDEYRISHNILKDPQFCEELLAKIRACLNKVEANWKSDYAMKLLVDLTLRALSLAPADGIVSIALNALNRIRTITQHWIRNLRNLLHQTTEEAQVQNLKHRLLKTAMLCKLTYDVDESHMSRVLGDENDLSVWVVSCVLVRENSPGVTTLLPSYAHRMYLHDVKLTHRLHRVAHRLIVTSTNLGLDQAVSKVWPNFQSASNCWDTLPDSKERWVTTQTKASPGCSPQKVLYNIVDGELLVDGRPLGRLPREYSSSEVYRRVFGPQILSVLIADMPGMLYMTATDIHGYIAYFTMREDVVVIKLRQNLQVFEYIPHETFYSDMPTHFVNDYVHWLDISGREIEFRPIKQQWVSNINNWRLQYQPESFSRLVQGNLTLIDVRSPTFAQTLDIFEALEDREHTHVFLDTNQQLQVHFPRFDLRFFLNAHGDFECHELCRIVDPDQSLGTMIGLKNRLVLCSIGQLARKHDRVVVIPDGRVSVSEAGSHVRVTISLSGRKIRLFRYQIDGVLRRLQGPGDILSSLYKVYLHAVTSHVLPDPFTRVTGTEEALKYLKSNSISLTKPADEETIRLLKSIAELTPARELYPEHLRMMQQVKWNPALSMVAQRDDFMVLAREILASGDRLLIFNPDSKAESSLYGDRDRDLLARAKARNSKFYHSGSGDTAVAPKWDVPYQARDHIPLGERATRTFSIASIVSDWPQKCEVSQGLLLELQAFGTISGFGKCFDSTKPLSELLDLSLATSWAGLFELCRSSSQQEDLYRLLFLFSTIAYGENQKDPVRLRTLLAFAFSHKLRASGGPRFPSYNLTHGNTFCSQQVRALVTRHLKGFTPSAYSKDPRAERRKYYVEKKKQVTRIVAHYSDQWPCKIPRAPRGQDAPLLNVQAASLEIRPLYASWTRNGELQGYISRVQSILDRMYDDRPVRGYQNEAWQTWHTQSRLDAAPLLPTLSLLMSAAAPCLPPKHEVLSINFATHPPASTLKLQSLVKALNAGNRSSSIREQYSNDLLASLDAFCRHRERIVLNILPCAAELLLLDRMECERYMLEIFECICNTLMPKNRISQLLEAGALWPRLTVRSVISFLLDLSKVPFDWSSCLLALGEAITMRQRARRLVLAAERDDIQGVCAELENAGRIGWESRLWPEWLLIEIENDLLIRPNQAQVALEMLNPSSSSNSLTQLNMV